MENRNFSYINSTSSTPFLHQLASSYGLATHYSSCDHPSLPNYMCLTGGSDYLSGESDPHCSPSPSCSVSKPSVVDEIENAGLTWKAYVENIPSPCYITGFYNYSTVTNPFVYYNDINGNKSRCNAHDVPANSGGNGLPDDNLVNDLSSVSTASNYMWLTPNLCDDMAGCSTSWGDSYLSQLVPKILDSFIFKSQKAALFITFDEGTQWYPNDYLYTIWAGPTVKSHYISSNQYSHYSLLRTLETAWNLQPLTANDSSAAPMTEFFQTPPNWPQINFSYTPNNPQTGQTVTFTASPAGGTQPYTPEWDLGDGSTGRGLSIGHVYSYPGNYTVALGITDANGRAAGISRTLTVGIPPRASGTCFQCLFARISGTTILSAALVSAGALVIVTIGIRVRKRTQRRTPGTIC